MRNTLGICLAIVVMLVIIGCTGGPRTDWTMTTSQNGVVTGVTNVEAPEAVNLDPAKFDIQIKDGKISWRADVENNTALRTMVMGVMTSVTADPSGTLGLTFSGTVEAKSTATFTDSTAVTGGLPAGIKIIRTNVAIIPGAGCETPTTHVPGNWPVQALKSEAQFTPVAQRTVIAPRVILAPEFTIDITGIEIDEKGGKKYFWVLTCENKEDVPVDLTVTVQWSFETGEKIVPSVLNFVLKGNERRVIDGAPVRTKKQFREVNGKAVLTGKKYVKLP